MNRIDWHAVARELMVHLERTALAVVIQDGIIEAQKAIIDKLKRENTELMNNAGAPWLPQNSPTGQRRLAQATEREEVHHGQ